jgi:hypothetical protein
VSTIQIRLRIGMRTFGVGETGGENDSCRAATGEFPVPSLDFLKNLVMPCPERGR